MLPWGTSPRTGSPWTASWLLIAVLGIALLPLAQAGMFTSDAISFCKCICFTNSTIIPLHRPTDPSQPCSSCTKQFCLDQKLAICRNAELPELDKDVGTGNEGDIEARCFNRDSPRDQLVVTLFILAVLGLLLVAAIRTKLDQAIESRGRPSDLKQWAEALLPDRLQPYGQGLMDKVMSARPRPARGNSGVELSDSAGRYAPVNA